MLESQTCMKSFHYGKKQLEEAIPSMPNLQHLTVTICDALTPASIHRFSFRAFYSGSPMPFDDIANGHAHRVPQLRAFYRAAFKHVLKLKSFACKGISWQLFKSAKKDLVKLAIVLLEADSMVLHLSASYGHGTGPETKHCQQYLKNGKVSDPLRQMEHLQNLELHMDQRPILAWELRHVVGSSTWGRLTRISLAYMEATEEDLVHFIERHARTLRNLYLSAIRFTHGKWITAFEWMQVCLNHKINVLVEGRLISQDPREAFFLGYRELEGMLVRSDRPCLNKRQRLANWFKDGGECPLVEC